MASRPLGQEGGGHFHGPLEQVFFFLVAGEAKCKLLKEKQSTMMPGLK